MGPHVPRLFPLFVSRRITEATRVAITRPDAEAAQSRRELLDHYADLQYMFGLRDELPEELDNVERVLTAVQLLHQTTDASVRDLHVLLASAFSRMVAAFWQHNGQVPSAAVPQLKGPSPLTFSFLFFPPGA
jgi:hypothetical protein